MEENDGKRITDDDKAPSLGRWMQQTVNRLLGQPESPDRALSRESPELPQSSSPPLTAKELDTLWTAYLQRLQQRNSSVHLYGLDARRRALQESGEALDLRGLYTPLNTTRLVSAEQEPSPARDALPSQTRTVPMRPLSLLEAVGTERRAIIRGPHGSGKSTFLRFVTLCLAADCMDDHEELARLQPTWKHGSVFPLLIDLRQLALSSYHDGTADGLCAYIAEDLDIYPDQLENQLIRPGGVLFLLDGIEAAPAATASFAGRYGDTDNLFFLTSQEYVDLADTEFSPLDSFAPVTLAPWTTDDTDKFAQKWYAELERKGWIDAESARDLPGQLRSALRRSEVAALAGRPSRMTLIALLQTMRASFPPDRVTFYHELIDRAITYWGEGGIAGERDLRQAFDKDDLRTAIAQVTYQAHARLEHPGDTPELTDSDLRAALVSVCREGRWDAVGDMVERFLTRPLLLEETAPGIYVFPDPSVQAYIAARHLSSEPELPQLVVRLAKEEFYQWRSVIRFAIARLAKLDDRVAEALETIDALCPRSLSDAEQVSDREWRFSWLAGEALLEASEERLLSAAPTSQGPRRQRSGPLAALPTLTRIQNSLAALLECGALTPRERAQAGNVLDRLGTGDPRSGVSSPEPVWCSVPAGPFWQGEGDEQHLVEMDSFWIARYPVTNAQYAVFVNATGHSPPEHWQGRRPPPGLGNHPAAYITWEDAIAYCVWWSTRFRTEAILIWDMNGIRRVERAPLPWTVRLPTSAEWEKAARGGTRIPGPEGDELIDNPHPRRIYPWGNSWRLSMENIEGDETRCNVSESNIGTTTPVGMYPGGASPYGAMDMAGNVWEWCLDWADPERRYRVRRGGAFRYTHNDARCSARDKAHPGLHWSYLGFRIVLGPPTSNTREQTKA